MSYSQETQAFDFTFQGEFSAKEVEKRLNKVLTLLEGENSQFKVGFRLVEVSDQQQSKELTSEREQELLDKIEQLKEQIEDLKTIKEDNEELEKMLQEGYNAAVHEGDKDYDQEVYGTIERGGDVLYQTYYICTDCNHRGKHYIPKSQIYIDCHDCGKQLRTRSAVKDDLSLEYQDKYGNYMIAGAFKRADELVKDKPLTEIWNIK